MGRKFINIKPIDSAGEQPDRPSDEVQWAELSNVWFDTGVMKKRPAMATAAHTAVAATCTANSPCHVITQFRHGVAIDADNNERPSSAGSNTNWTPKPSGNNFDLVNDRAVSDLTYVTHDTINEKDSYHFSNSSLTIIDKMTLKIRAERSRENSYKVKFFARTAGAAELNLQDANGNDLEITIPAATGDSAVFEDFYVDSTIDPHTAATWTAVLFNAYEFGFFLSELNADTFTETLGPSGTGTHSDFTIESASAHANYQVLYNTNNAFASGQIPVDDYVWSRDNSDKMSLQFTAGRAFTTITNAYLEVYRLDVYGRRKMEVYLDDSGTEHLHSTYEYTALKPHKHTTLETDPSNIKFLPQYQIDLTTLQPSLIDFVDTNNVAITASSGFTEDPVTDTDWSAATIYGYEWVLKNTTTKSHTTIEDHMRPYGILNQNNDSSVFYYLDGVLTKTITKHSITAANIFYSGATDFYGELLPSPVKDFDPFWHGASNWYYEIGITDESSLLIYHSLPLIQDAAAVYSVREIYNIIYGESWGGAYYFGDFVWTKGVMGIRDNWSQMKNILNPFGSFNSVGYTNFFDSSGGNNPYVQTADEGWVEATDPFYATNLIGRLPYCILNLQSTSQGSSYKARVRNSGSAIFLWLWPENRTYTAKLKLTGTAVAKPKISMFNITIEGATAGTRRESKILVTSTDIQRYDDAATLIDVIGGVTNPSALDTVRWDTAKFFGKQYFTNGVNYIYRYPDATDTIDELTTVHLCKTLSSFIGRLFTGGTTETATYFPDRVRWSIIEDDSDWAGTGSGYLDLNDTDGEVLKLLPLGGILVGYKDTSIYNLHPTGDRDDAIVKTVQSPAIGVLAPSTVKAVVNKEGLPAHIFLGQGRGGVNVYMYTSNILIPIGDAIKEELRDNMDPRQSKNAFAAVDYKRNQYLFFVAYKGETFPRKAWTYEIDTGAWKSWELINPITTAGVWKTTESTPDVEEWTILFGEQTSLVKWANPGAYQDHDGTNVTMIAESGDYAVEARANYGTIYRMHVYYYDYGYTPIRVAVSTDGGDNYGDETTYYIGQADGSADGSLRSAKIDLLATGKRFRVMVTHDDNAKIALSEFQLEIEEQGWIV